MSRPTPKPTASGRMDGDLGASANDLLGFLDARPLGARYWSTAILTTLIAIFDYFDFFLVSFLIAVVSPAWHMTYFQTSLVLLAAGVGAISGGLVCGPLSDRFGRKPVIVSASLLCGLASGTIAFIPDGGWVWFAVLRFFVGCGVAGVSTASSTLIVEFTPTRLRTGLASALVVPVGLGVLFASILAAVMLPVIGWRGLAVLGYIPVVFSILAFLILPESSLWLIGRGRGEIVRQRLSRQTGILLAAIPSVPTTSVDAGRRPAPLRELWLEPRRFWLVALIWFGISTAIYGVLLWGPTVVSMVLEITPQAAARQFIVIGVAGIIGRILFSVAPQRFGRRRCGQVAGFGGALCLSAAALFHNSMIGTVPIFVICLFIGSLFYDGVTANFGPWPAEIFPVRLAARAVGLSQAANGLGKIAGPLCLALLAGNQNLVAPKATEAAVLPAFFFLAACCLLAALACTFIPIETHRRPLVLDDG